MIHIPKSKEAAEIEWRLFSMVAFGYDPAKPPPFWEKVGGIAVTLILISGVPIMILAAVCVSAQIK